jgi:hypothetical protein
MRGREMMEVNVSGFAEHQGGYFISRESASGVMTGWRTLMGIPNSRVRTMCGSRTGGWSLSCVMSD